MTDDNKILQFNVENPPDLYSKRGSTVSSDNGMIIEDIDSNDNIIFESEASSINSAEKTKRNEGKVYCGIRADSEISCILNIIVSAIGGGCFRFSYMMEDGGIFVSLAILIFVTACIYFTIDLLRSFVVETKYFSFALMTETILGARWLQLYAVCSLIIYMSMEVSYIGSIYSHILEIFNTNNALFIFFYFLISIVVEIIICMYISKLAKMHLLSIISVSCFFILFFSLIVISLAANIKGEVGNKFTVDNLFFPHISPNTTVNRLLKISSYIMVYVYGYSYHSTFPTLLGNLHTVNHNTTKKVHLISFGIIFLSIVFMTIFGFILSDEVPQEIFKDNAKYFTGGWAYLIIPYKLVLCIYYLTLIPIRFIVVRDNYITLIGEKRITFFRELLIISVFIFISNIFVFGVGFFKDTPLYDLNISSMIQAFGGIFGVIISFCLPVVNYVSINGKKKMKSLMGYVITGFFCIVGVFSATYTFYQLIFGNESNKNDKNID